MDNNLILYNGNMCKQNYEYCLDSFSMPKNNLGDYTLEVLKILTVNNPISSFCSMTETIFKSYVFLKNNKYRLKAVRYLKDVEVERIRAFVELDKIEKQTQLITLAIDRDYQKNIRIIENNKFLSLAQIEANLQVELRKCDAQNRQIIKRIVNANALFSQNVRLLNSNRQFKQQLANGLSRIIVEMPNHFLQSGARDWNLSREKQIVDDYFEKFLCLTDNHYNYIDIEQFIRAMR